MGAREADASCRPPESPYLDGLGFDGLSDLQANEFGSLPEIRVIAETLPGSVGTIEGVPGNSVGGGVTRMVDAEYFFIRYGA